MEFLWCNHGASWTHGSPFSQPNENQRDFLSTWTVPPGITASICGPSFAYCKLCQDHFSAAHGGLMMLQATLKERAI